jgi:hypothetical protein
MLLLLKVHAIEGYFQEARAMELTFHLRTALNDSRVHFGILAIGAIALCLELWSVSSAIATRGAELCLTDYTAQRAGGRHCVADRLVAELTGSEQLAQYLRGNCQGAPREGIIAAHRPGQPTVVAAGPVCTIAGRGST